MKTSLSLPPFTGFPLLKGHGVFLRDSSTEDLQELLEISFYNGKAASSIEEAAQMLDKIQKDYQGGSSVHWVVADPVSDEVMGTVGFYRGFHRGWGELGFILRPKFRGNGIMGRAVDMAVTYGFLEMGLAGILARTSPSNMSSRTLLSRRGFSLEQEHSEELVYTKEKAEHLGPASKNQKDKN